MPALPAPKTVFTHGALRRFTLGMHRLNNTAQKPASPFPSAHRQCFNFMGMAKAAESGVFTATPAPKLHHHNRFSFARRKFPITPANWRAGHGYQLKQPFVFLFTEPAIWLPSASARRTGTALPICCAICLLDPKKV